MKPFFAYLLILLVLLQTFSREVLVVDFTLNRATITARFCVNKARPQLHCNGKCYFAKLLKKQRESKVPSPLKERLKMLSAGLSFLLPTRPASYPALVQYGRAGTPTVPSLGLRAVFHPPQHG